MARNVRWSRSTFIGFKIPLQLCTRRFQVSSLRTESRKNRHPLAAGKDVMLSCGSNCGNTYDPTKVKICSMLPTRASSLSIIEHLESALPSLVVLVLYTTWLTNMKSPGFVLPCKNCPVYIRPPAVNCLSLPR